MGTPDFSVPILKRLVEEGYDVAAVVTQPDRPVGRKKVMTPPPVKVEAVNLGIPVFQPEKIRVAEETEKILAIGPDLIITAAFGQILPKEILEFPKLGCINVHASLLPELRGGAPIHYAILQGKDKTGVTIMHMVEKLDAGDMISQVEVPIEEDDDVGSLHDKLSSAGAELLSDTLPKIISGEADRIPQNEDLATFAANITREQEKIDWKKTGGEIYDQIRGLRPWPVAYTKLNNEVLKIWGAQKQAGQVGEPGTIIKVEKDGFIVSSGDDTAIKITELQPAGKKRMPASQFLMGAGSFLEPGLKLGGPDE
ncbi:methionyl-tRNA formyltransferase [Siminovitchia fortis]|uniref:Methionyl-tRNA formyltransferase n=2 Tax=Siminovitchia fortis TaxID=254758 RepID=A0A443J0U8_9BACI|nr:methionyl-tRNA formyltransferase [Siminovitchia fortis]